MRLFSKQLWLVVIVIVLLTAGGAFYALHTRTNPTIFSNVENSPEATDTPAVDTAPLATSTPATEEVGQGERLYQSSAFHFAVTYPDNLQATEYQERGGSLTATFQDPSTNEGFEVYVTPYAAKQIDESRFTLDEPSGVMRQPTNIILDGVHATMFFGRNSIMGDTREVWFIHGGFLYEVTTYKELDAWLSQIMNSWKFI